MTLAVTHLKVSPVAPIQPPTNIVTPADWNANHVIVANGSPITDVTGSGNLVLQTSPTIITPTLSGKTYISGPLGVGTETNPQSTTVISQNPATGVTTGISDVLTVIGPNNNNAFIGFQGYGGFFGALQFRRSEGFAGSESFPAGGVQLGQVTATGWINGSGWATAKAVVRLSTQNAWSASDNSTFISFLTTPPGSTVLGETARFTSSGGLSVGTSVVALDPGMGNIKASSNTAVWNVGVAGSTTPIELIAADGAAAAMTVSTFNSLGFFAFRRADGTAASPQAVGAANARVGGFYGYAWRTVTSSGYNVVAGIEFRTAEAQTSTAAGSYTDFYNCAPGSTTLNTIMHIQGNGDIGFNTGTPTHINNFTGYTFNGTGPTGVFFDWAVNGGVGARAVYNTGASFIYVIIDTAAAMQFKTNGAQPVQFLTNNTSNNIMQLFGDGGVGIGPTVVSSGGNGTLRVGASTASSSSTTGALVVTGGVGIGGSIFCGGSLQVLNTMSAGRLLVSNCFLAIGPATAGNAISLNIASSGGATPPSPVDGDMWYDGTNVRFRVGGTTKNFTLV